MKSCPYALNNISDRCKQGFYDHHADGSTATNMPQAHSLLDLTVDLQGHFFSFRPPGQLLVTQICVHREISSLTKADQKLNQHYEKKCLCCLRTKQEHTRLLQEHTEGIQNIKRPHCSFEGRLSCSPNQDVILFYGFSQRHDVLLRDMTDLHSLKPKC